MVPYLRLGYIPYRLPGIRPCIWPFSPQICNQEGKERTWQNNSSHERRFRRELWISAVTCLIDRSRSTWDRKRHHLTYQRYHTILRSFTCTLYVFLSTSGSWFFVVCCDYDMIPHTIHGNRRNDSWSRLMTQFHVSLYRGTPKLLSVKATIRSCNCLLTDITNFYWR